MSRHSRLSGSQDLELWAKSGGDSVREAYKEHLMGPIIAVKDELFKTFRQEALAQLWLCLHARVTTCRSILKHLQMIHSLWQHLSELTFPTNMQFQHELRHVA